MLFTQKAEEYVLQQKFDIILNCRKMGKLLRCGIVTIQHEIAKK